MSVYVPRAGWGALPPRGALTPWDPAKLDGVTVHWFGSPNGTTDHSLCAGIVRGVQRSHQAGEFLDIAYNDVVCPHGYIYEGRGFGYQTGANGYKEVNRSHAAVCFMMGTQNIAGLFGATAKAAMQDILYMWFQRGTEKTVKRHGFWTGSECPGPTIGPWVDSGLWRRETTPVATSPVPDWFDDFMYWKLVTSRYDPPAPRPAGVPTDVPQWAHDLVAVGQKCIVQNGAAESFLSYAEGRLVDGVKGVPPNMTAVPNLWWPDLEAVHRMLNRYADTH